MPALSGAIFDLVDQIAAADSVSGVWDVYLGATKAVGLDFGVACHMPVTPNEPIAIVTDALPSGWLKEYYSQGLDAGDLLVERTRLSTSTFTWSMGDWDVAGMSPIQQRWRDHNLHSGILGGISILNFRRGEHMLLIACGRDGQMHTHDKLAVDFAGQEAMLRLRELAVPAAMDFAPLSQRERECLQWAAQGKTDWEIGQILSLSEKTVNVYINRAKTKFGVKTRAQAILAAFRAGAIAA